MSNPTFYIRLGIFIKNFSKKHKIVKISIDKPFFFCYNLIVKIIFIQEVFYEKSIKYNTDC